MAELGKAYELGLGVAADPVLAKQWRDRAKAAPDPANRKDPLRSDQRVDPRRSKP
jgi:TPR repeat protein